MLWNKSLGQLCREVRRYAEDRISEKWESRHPKHLVNFLSSTNPKVLGPRLAIIASTCFSELVVWWVQHCLTRLHWKFFWCLTNLGSIKLNGWHQLQLTGKSGWTALRSDVIGSHWCPSVRETDTGHNWDTGLGTNWKSDPRRTTTLQDASNVHGSDTLKTQTSFWVFEHIGSYRHIWASSRSSRIGFFQVAEGDHIDTLRAAAKSLGNVQFCWHCRASSAPKIIAPEQTPKTTNLAT